MMKFNLTIDKKAEAVINDKLCINCGKCEEICPTHAIGQCQKTVYCMFPDCGQGKGADTAAKYFRDAKCFATEASCWSGCPLGIMPQSVAALVKRGDLEGAYKLIDEKNPMPWVCASVCDNLCQDYCKRGNMLDTAINMRALEGYVLSKAHVKPYKYTRLYSERIAVIGGGPSGLTAALELSKAGYEATIFEKDGKLGGALSWGIPGFRLDKERLAREIDRILSAGIRVRYNHEIGKDYTIDDIWKEGFCACIIAAGASEGVKADIPGADVAMVYDGVEVMRWINGGEAGEIELGESIVVIGNGEFAADTARVIRRLGKRVICASLEHPDELHISESSVNALAAEGIELKTLTGPKQIISEDNKVKAVEFMKAEYIEDDKGRLRAHGIKGSEFNVFCDSVVFAIGRRCNVSNISNVETYPNGRVKTDASHRTNKDMIFACGDAALEGGSVAAAMASGRSAAIEVDAILRRTGKVQRKRSVKNAPDVSIIYPDNALRLRPQLERVMRQGEEKNNEGKVVTDILPILRAAGIQESMQRFTYKDSEGKAKRRVAVIGGGIAGVTAAIDLAKDGYRPVIFEKSSALGGSCRWLASEKRLDKELLETELAKVPASGIEVIYNVNAGAKPDIEELFASGYEAVLFAIGESCGGRPDMENVYCRGVFDMVSLMGRLADSEEIDGVGQQVIVTGCDEMTFDAARQLKEYCRQVTVLSPLGKGGLRNDVASVAAALEDGVNLVTGVELAGINQENGRLKNIKCRILEKNVTIEISCDTLVIGGTQKPDTSALSIRNPKLEIDENGYIEADERLITSIYGVFAIGDFDMSSVDAGHAGAATVKSFMEGKDIVKAAEKKSHDKPEDVPKYEIFEGRSLKKAGFETGRRIFDARQAAIEASRCLGCGYRHVSGESCIGCNVCASVCPVNAVTLRPIAADEAAEKPEVNAEEV